MRLATLLWLLCSVAGLSILLIVGCAWLLIRPRARAPRVWLLSVVAAYTIGGIYPVPHALGAWWSREFVPLTDLPAGRAAVMILGSGSYTVFDWAGGRTAVPDVIGLARTLEAARIYRLIDPPWVISSGGPARADSPYVPAARAMRDELVRLGVPASRIVLVDQTRDTHDEAQTAASLLPSLKVNRIVLVTSALHMRRALAAFRAAGIDAVPAPAREEGPGRLSWQVRLLPSELGLYETALVTHEIVGFAYYGIRRWR